MKSDDKIKPQETPSPVVNSAPPKIEPDVIEVGKCPTCGRDKCGE